MSLDQSCSRIDTLELKALIVRKIGVQRAERYFDHLRRLFSLKISKCEFNRLCVRTIGRENLSLHNHLIRSVARNACLSKAPPARATRKLGGGPHKSRLQSPSSPRKKVQPLPLPTGRPSQQSATELLSLGSRPPAEGALSVEDGEEVEQAAGGSPGVQSRSPVTAPFGVSVNAPPRKAPRFDDPLPSLGTCRGRGELPDTGSLRNRVRRKLEAEGLGVSVDCVNVLNGGLDAYLKRLIESCARLAGTRRASLLDFRAAVELNPRLLGEDWALQFERIGFRASEKY